LESHKPASSRPVRAARRTWYAKPLRSFALGSGHELIAEAVDREDVARLAALGLDLLAQLDDEVVDGAVGRVRLEPPNLVEDLVAGDGLAALLPEHAQELDLVEAQLNLAPLPHE